MAEPISVLVAAIKQSTQGDFDGPALENYLTGRQCGTIEALRAVGSDPHEAKELVQGLTGPEWTGVRAMLRKFFSQGSIEEGFDQHSYLHGHSADDRGQAAVGTISPLYSEANGNGNLKDTTINGAYTGSPGDSWPSWTEPARPPARDGRLRFVWRRWLLYAPLLIGCCLLILLAGPSANQNFFFDADGAQTPDHRQPNFVEERHAATLRTLTMRKLWSQYDEVDFRGLPNRHRGGGKTRNFYTPRQASNCSAAFLNGLLPDLGSVTHTNPAKVREYLNGFRLGSFRAAERVLGRHLHEPVPVGDFIAKSASCVAGNAMLVEWGCELLARENLTIHEEGGYVVGAEDTRDFVTYMVVMDTLTKAAVNDALFASTMVLESRRGFDEDGGLDLVGKDDPLMTEKTKSFLRDKVQTMQLALDLFRRLRQLPTDANPGLTRVGKQRQDSEIERILQLNVLEAVATDLEFGLQENALAGLSVATFVASRGLLQQTRNEYNGSNLRMFWPLGKDWEDAYVAWNTAFVLNIFAPKSGSVAKLLIPSVMCTTEADGGDEWMSARAYSLFLTLHNMGNRPNYTTAGGGKSREYLEEFGKSNLRSIGIPVATESDTAWMVQAMPNTYSPGGRVDSRSWQMLVCLALWGSVMVLGWGMEIVVISSSAGAFAPSKGPESTRRIDPTPAKGTQATSMVTEYSSFFQSEEYWRAAQLCFPLFLSIAAFSRSVFGLPFLVAGLWKMACPEATVALLEAHLPRTVDGPVRLGWAVGQFLDGLGTVFHHSATSWYICLLVTGVFTPEADPDVILSVAIPLVFQHWAVQLKYVSVVAYVVVELGLEIWWEMECFNAIRIARYWHEQRSLWGMLVAHWCYWVGGTLLFLFPPAGLSRLQPLRRPTMRSVLAVLQPAEEADPRSGVGVNDLVARGPPEGIVMDNSPRQVISQSSL